MKFFTREWVSGEPTPSGAETVPADYRRHLHRLNLPASLLTLAEVNAHDGYLLNVTHSHRDETLCLRIRIGDLQSGYCDATLTFSGARIDADELCLLTKLTRPALFEILAKEVDRADAGNLECRFLFYPSGEVAIRFAEVTVACKPVSDRLAPWCLRGPIVINEKRRPEAKEAARMSIRNWSRLTDLVGYAQQRHGFGDTDGGFGITYPSDLDEFDRQETGIIPNGYVIATGFGGADGGWGGHDVLVPETLYLSVLAEMLEEKGHLEQADVVRAMMFAVMSEAGRETMRTEITTDGDLNAAVVRWTIALTSSAAAIASAAFAAAYSDIEANDAAWRRIKLPTGTEWFATWAPAGLAFAGILLVASVVFAIQRRGNGVVVCACVAWLFSWAWVLACFFVWRLPSALIGSRI